MNSKKSQLTILAFFVVTALLWLWLHQKSQQHVQPIVAAPIASPTPTVLVASPSASPISTPLPPPTTEEMIKGEREREKKMWNLWLATPISFYGKVVDEKGISIPGAKVHVSMHDHLYEGYTEKELLSDKDGLFSVEGHGLGLGVMVSKDGYYHLRESDGSFGYAKSAGTGKPHPDPSDPAIFVLRKMGKIEPLVMKGTGGSLAKNGAPTEISLQSGRKVPAGQGDVRIECWTNDQGLGPNSNDPFDWKCRITVNGGGVAERKGEFDFEAPTDGYQQSAEINMPKSMGDQWRSSITKDYFLKLANGSFARIRFMMNAGGEQTFSLTGYLNPQPGSRNLEFDPAKQINSQ